MIKNITKGFFAIVATATLATSCSKQLDLKEANTLDADAAYNSPAAYKQGLAKVYSGFAVTNSFATDGSDILGIDAGTSDFYRLFWKLQETSTDEAIIGWGDPGIQDIHNMNWTASNVLTRSLYSRSMLQVTYANEFLRQSTPDKLTSRGITGVADVNNINFYRAEARFLRAFQYWVVLDAYGMPPFQDENTPLGGPGPRQMTKVEAFNFIESELKAIEPLLIAAKGNEYGRVDRAACQALLARLYLNAQVYTGTARYADAAIYARKVIDVPGYSLINNYRHLMLADNNLNTNENIFSIAYDGLRTQTFGGTTFLTHASIGGSMQAGDYGVNGGWGGIRTTKNLPNLFPDYTGTLDKRAQFFTTGQNLEIAAISSFTEGFAVTKYVNKTRTGAQGSNDNFVDIDMPLFRLAEMYLIYAEAFARGASGTNAADALTYINNIRTRAYGNTSGNLASPAAITTAFIIDERGRELYWEGHRRTDLIRYGLFTTSTYLWPWKGGSQGGTSVGAHRNLYPIPDYELTANPNMVQNSPLY